MTEEYNIGTMLLMNYLEVKAPNRVSVQRLSQHQQERSGERALEIHDIKDAILNLLHIYDVKEYEFDRL